MASAAVSQTYRLTEHGAQMSTCSSPSETEIATISRELKARAEIALEGQPADARSPSAISMMLARFKALETKNPSNRGISAATEAVWDEFGRSVKQNSKQIWDAAKEVRDRWTADSRS